MITVLLVDDHQSIRRGLRHLLENAGDIQVLETASNGAEAVEQVRLHCPDVAVVDISMPVMDGLEATAHIRELCELTRVLILSMHDHAEYVRGAVEAGAHGYILKEMVAQDLLAGIRALFAGKHYFGRQVAGMAEKFMDEKKKKQ